MNRREFLDAVSAVGIAAAAPFHTALAATATGALESVNRVAVIGAGIVGSAIAYYLSKRGCDVVLLDKTGPAAQASGNSFAWINASYFDAPHSYYTLREHSLNEYHRLAQEVDLPIRWGGSLEWYDSANREMEIIEGVARIQQAGAATWVIDKQGVAEIEPNLSTHTGHLAAYASRDGAIDPGQTTRTLVKRSKKHGATVIFPALVTSIKEQSKGLLVETDIESFEVDVAVVAAGVSANEMGTKIGLATNLLNPATPGIIVTTSPMPQLINTVCYTDDVHFHQLNDGRVIIGEKAGPPKTDQHLGYLNDQPNEYPTAELAMEHASRIINIATRYVPQFGQAEVQHVGVGWRPLPVDGLPIIGRVPDMQRVYVASMHSGVTLAPIVGHLAALEILDGVSVDLFSDFRIDRLA